METFELKTFRQRILDELELPPENARTIVANRRGLSVAVGGGCFGGGRPSNHTVSVSVGSCVLLCLPWKMTLLTPSETREATLLALLEAIRVADSRNFMHLNRAEAQRIADALLFPGTLRCGDILA